MEFIGSTLDLDLAFDDQSGWYFEALSFELFSHFLINLGNFTADAELQDNSLFASSNNSYVSQAFNSSQPSEFDL